MVFRTFVCLFKTLFKDQDVEMLAMDLLNF